MRELIRYDTSLVVCSPRYVDNDGVLGHSVNVSTLVDAGFTVSCRPACHQRRQPTCISAAEVIGLLRSACVGLTNQSLYLIKSNLNKYERFYGPGRECAQQL